jgi:hypothetical protein
LILHRMMMALLQAKRDGSLFAVALYCWKQPIENMFAVQAPKLWSPEPSTSFPCIGYLTDTFGCRAVASGGVLLNFQGTLPFLWMAFGGFSMVPALFSLKDNSNRPKALDSGTVWHRGRACFCSSTSE